MKIKQKIVFAAAILGLVCSFSVMLMPSSTIFAQEAPDCGTNPDGAGCKPSEPGTASPPKEVPACKKGDADCCGGVKTSIISGDMCDDEGDGGVIFGLLKWVLRIMTAGVGVAAVGGIAYGALLYTTAESKPEQTKKAIGIITNVVIGIAAYALMAVLLNFLIPGGVLD